MDKELKIKKDEQAAELWTATSPSAKQCRTCKFAYADTKYTKGREKANCMVYESPEDKPHEVLWDGADCEFYTEKKS